MMIFLLLFLLPLPVLAAQVDNKSTGEKNYPPGQTINPSFVVPDNNNGTVKTQFDCSTTADVEVRTRRSYDNGVTWDTDGLQPPDWPKFVRTAAPCVDRLGNPLLKVGDLSVRGSPYPIGTVWETRMITKGGAAGTLEVIFELK